MNKILLVFFTNLCSLVAGCFLGGSLYKIADDIGWADALHVLRYDAVAGDPESQYYGGLYIHKGKGVTPNIKKVFIGYQKRQTMDICQHK